MCLFVLHSCQHHTWHRWRAKHNRAGIPAGLRQGCRGSWPEGWIWWFSRWAGWSWEPCFVCSTSLWSISVSHRVWKWRILHLKQSSLCAIFVHTLKKFIIVKVIVFDNFISWFYKKFNIFFISYLQYFLKLYNLLWGMIYTNYKWKYSFLSYASKSFFFIFQIIGWKWRRRDSASESPT